MASSSLVILGCSATKFDSEGNIPAVHLYDGPMYRVLRSRLRKHRWPDRLRISVLSAKYGLIGSVAPIQHYEQRMTAARAQELGPTVNAALMELAETNKNIHIILGKDYLHSINLHALSARANVDCAAGPIGEKLHTFSQLLSCEAKMPRIERPLPRSDRPLYFLPDWDDFLDADFDFQKDQFSTERRTERNEVHMIELLHPTRICDGILVSLAQHLGTKGLLRRVPLDDPYLTRPTSVREHFGLDANQWAFGDCGAFSYANDDEPAISVNQAVAVYDLYEFDLGASVDHIPLKEIYVNNKKRSLTYKERQERIKLTRANAQDFIDVWRDRNCSFTPVGIIQSIDATGYAAQISDYLDMGYQHIALGGLVPRSDEEIAEVVRSVSDALKSEKYRPWIHLLGVFRPKIQDKFRAAGINSFDSASGSSRCNSLNRFVPVRRCQMIRSFHLPDIASRPRSAAETSRLEEGIFRS